MDYIIRKTAARPTLTGDWDGPIWQHAHTLEVGLFHRRSGMHRPRTQARLLFDQRAIYVHFRVQDRYVRSVHTGYQSPVFRDSCVEFFVEPLAGRGYFNFEVNAGGAILLRYQAGGNRLSVSDDWLDQVPIYHSLPERVDPEILEPVTWSVEYAVPLGLFEAYLQRGDLIGEAPWRANFYKCADATSHPHWASWKPIGRRMSFHVPDHFAPIGFER